MALHKHEMRSLTVDQKHTYVPAEAPDVPPAYTETLLSTPTTTASSNGPPTYSPNSIPVSTLGLPLTLQTAHSHLSSDFSLPPPALLSALSIPSTLWKEFTSSILAAGKLTRKQWAGVIAAGASLELIGATSAGFFLGNAMLKKKNIKNLTGAANANTAVPIPTKEHVDGDEFVSAEQMLAWWNSEVFGKRGVSVRLVLPRPKGQGCRGRRRRSGGCGCGADGMHQCGGCRRGSCWEQCTESRKFDPRRFAIVIEPLGEGAMIEQGGLRESMLT